MDEPAAGCGDLGYRPGTLHHHALTEACSTWLTLQDGIEELFDLCSNESAIEVQQKKSRIGKTPLRKVKEVQAC